MIGDVFVASGVGFGGRAEADALGVLGLSRQQPLERAQHDDRNLGTVHGQGGLSVLCAKLYHVAVHHLEQVVLEEHVVVRAAGTYSGLAEALVCLVENDDQAAASDIIRADAVKDVPQVQAPAPPVRREPGEVYHADQTGIFF